MKDNGTTIECKKGTKWQSNTKREHEHEQSVGYVLFLQKIHCKVFEEIITKISEVALGIVKKSS